MCSETCAWAMREIVNGGASGAERLHHFSNRCLKLFRKPEMLSRRIAWAASRLTIASAFSAAKIEDPAGIFFGGLLNAFLPTAADVISQHVGRPSVAIGVAVLCLFPIVMLSIKWLNYSNTVYRVYSNRIEIQEGFLTQHRKEIQISSIREINLRRGILQRLVGLGSVYLATLATGQGQWWQSSASTFGSGAMLMDLINPDAGYEQLRGLVDTQAKAIP